MNGSLQQNVCTYAKIRSYHMARNFLITHAAHTQCVVLLVST